MHQSQDFSKIIFVNMCHALSISDQQLTKFEFARG
jgi:hypothetical protein